MSNLSNIKGYLMLKSLGDVFIGINEEYDYEHYQKVKRDLLKFPIRIIDIGVGDSGYLCVSPDASCLVDVRNKSTIRNIFFCDEEGDILIPPGIDDTVKRMAEFAKRSTRPGGYDRTIRNMVIAASLCKGEFYDGFLFRNEPNVETEPNVENQQSV